MQRGVEEAPFRECNFAQPHECIPPRIEATQRTQHETHIGNLSRTARGGPAVELEVQTDVGVELVPSHLERIARSTIRHARNQRYIPRVAGHDHAPAFSRASVAKLHHLTSRSVIYINALQWIVVPPVHLVMTLRNAAK
jgi:hypothetical protein